MIFRSHVVLDSRFFLFDHESLWRHAPRCQSLRMVVLPRAFLCQEIASNKRFFFASPKTKSIPCNSHLLMRLSRQKPQSPRMTVFVFDHFSRISLMIGSSDFTVPALASLFEERHLATAKRGTRKDYSRSGSRHKRIAPIDDPAADHQWHPRRALYAPAYPYKTVEKPSQKSFPYHDGRQQFFGSAILIRPYWRQLSTIESPLASK